LLGRVGWGDIKTSTCRFLLNADKEMKEILKTGFYFPSPNPLPLERAFKGKRIKT
jgi:hypothetical protein